MIIKIEHIISMLVQTIRVFFLMKSFLSCHNVIPKFTSLLTALTYNNTPIESATNYGYFSTVSLSIYPTSTHQLS